MSTGQPDRKLSWIERLRARLNAGKTEDQTGGSHMKISYSRTGGFAGMLISYEIDLGSLPPEEAVEVSGLVDSADFFGLPSEIRSEVVGADQFQYTLTIVTVEQQHTVDVGDGAVPENLWPLLNKIRILSRSSGN